MNGSEGPRTARECEAWFLDHGLPWFVAAEDERVARALDRHRVWRPALLVAVVLAAAVFAFFVVAIQGDVVEAWIGHPPTERHWTPAGLDVTRYVAARSAPDAP